MRDPCEIALAATPHVTAAAGWLWSEQNPPEDIDEHLPGKWMLFPPCQEAVAAWRVVVQTSRAGDIWSAKIAPQARSRGHLICVYTPDFTKQVEVERVALVLNDLGLVQRRMYYKPDIFTYTGIYRQSGRSGQRASIYEYVPGEGTLRTTPALGRARELLAATGRAR